MKRTRLVRVTPNLYYLIESVRLLNSNDNGFQMSFTDASEKTFELFIKFANWDITIGNRVMNEFKKVKKNAVTRM